MPRGQLIRKKKVVLDPRYKNPVIEKFITRMMLQGKKNIATHIIYGALDIVTKKVGKDAVEVFQKARADAAIIAGMIHTGEYTIPQIKADLARAGVPVRRTW